MTTTVPTASRREWLVPAGLILLAAIPVLAGGVRLAGWFTRRLPRHS
jgi:hypothetical protein